MPQAPIAGNESQRLCTLHQICVLDTQPEAAFDDLAALARRLCAVPIAAVSLVDVDRQWFKSILGLEVRQTPRSMAFCAYTILTNEPMVVCDATLDPRFADNPLVTGEPFIRFYAGVPLQMGDGTNAGSLCIIDTVARTLTTHQLNDLIALAGQVSAQLKLRRSVVELTQSRRAAESANRSKSAFLANMSHEIRTPLAAVVGFVDMLAESLPVSSESQEHIQIIRRNSQHLLSLINDVLDVSKIDAGQFVLEWINCSPVDLLNSASEMFIPQARAKGIELKTSLQSPVPEVIVCDPTRLRQILINLIGNAVKFTQVGGIEISLRVRVVPDDIARDHDVALEYEIRDSGPGIEREQLGNIFKPFEQADVTTTRHYGGTGLGLTISQHIAALLGGSVRVVSELGVGSSFILELPARIQGGTAYVSQLHTQRASAQQPQLKSTADGVVRTVLIAEDTPDNQRLILYLLRDTSLKIEIVNNGRLAVERLCAQLPDGTSGPDSHGIDLVLMDLQMPEMDGTTALKTLRAQGCAVPVVALTACALSNDEVRCNQAGFQDFLSKPYTKSQLLGVCEKWLGPIGKATSHGA